MSNIKSELTEIEIWKEVSGVEPQPRFPVGVSVSLNFPGMTQKLRREMKSLIVNTLETLVSLDMHPILLDATALELPSIEDHELEGLVVLGGGDVHPKIAKHEPDVPNAFGADARADTYTISLIRQAFEQKIPILGICRGAQILNVSYGGTIIPDLGEFTIHRTTNKDDQSFAVEAVELKEESRVGKIYGSNNVRVFAAHHQAIDRVGDGFMTTAWARDGNIEAIEHQRSEWVVGVQWHPEVPEADRGHFLGMLNEFKSAMSSS